MSICFNCKREISNNATKCRYCFVENYPEIHKDILLASTGSVSGYEIIEYKGIAYGECVCPNGILGALTQGTFFTYSAVAQARDKALEALKVSARGMDANAVVGVDIDICDLNGNGSFVSVNGTAVYMIPENHLDNMVKQEERNRLIQAERVAEQQRIREERVAEQQRIREEHVAEQQRIREVIQGCIENSQSFMELNMTDLGISEKYTFLAKSILKEINIQDQPTVSSLVRVFSDKVDSTTFRECMDELMKNYIIYIDEFGYIRF